MKSHLLKRIIIISGILLLSVFAVYAQTENKIVTITDPLDASKALTYSGTYVYQGTRSSGGAGPVKVRPYYKNGTYYLFADYYSGSSDFPNGFAWFITNNILTGNPPSWVYYGWDGTSGMNYPEQCTWWGDYSGNTVTVTVNNAVSGVAPSVTTMEASLVTTTSGTMGGNIVSDGGATASRGFVYSSTDPTPTIGESGVTQITMGTGTGTYTDVVSSLTAGVTYYYQAYGTNTYGTNYGGVKNFTTPTTSSPNKLVSGITTPSAANGVYVWIGNYYGKPAWKHQSQNYWVYYSPYGAANPTTYYWYIDGQLRNEHGAGDYFFYHTDVASCPASGWASGSGNGTGVGTPSVVDYPQIDFTNGSAYSPGNPTGGTTNNPIGRFYLDADIAGASLTAATITVTGTRSGVTNLKIWSSASSTFSAGTATQLNSQSDGSSVTFSGFSSAISASGTYYFITTDLGVSATGSFALTIGSIANLTISGGASSTVFSNAALSSGTITIIPAIDINVKGNGNSITSGDVTPSLTDHTDFGSADIATGSVVRTFTIESVAAGTLTLTGSSPYVVISGSTSEFTLTQTPSSSISGGSSTTFQITFNPTSTGLKSASVSIASNDADENPYTFSIQGTGTAAPEMDVSGNGNSITDGDVTPSVTDYTDYGNVNISTGSVEHTFTITNTGSAALNLTGSSPYVVISGATGDFSLTQTPSNSIAASGGTTTFKITFNPTVTGLRSAAVSIADDDGDENPYNFNIQGTGITVPTLTTSAALSILTTSATLGGNITSDGGAAVTGRGIVYSTSDATPTIAEGATQVSIGSGTGSFSQLVGSLSLATHYYFQAYAINSEGTSYGGVQEFTTQNTISSINRTASTPNNSTSVSWTVTFAASVTGLTSSNFTLVNSGLTGPSISTVTGSGTSWTVSANTGTGSGTLGLNFTSNSGLNADISNNPFTGQVYTIDKSAPTLTSTSPSDNDITAYLGTNLIFNFNENIVAGTGYITIRKSSDASIKEQISITSAIVTISGSKVTVNPAGVLARATGYYIEVDPTALTDIAGNPFAGISGNTAFNFNTVNVLVNEVVTSPKQDWSTNNFNGVVGAGSVDEGTDEWIELLINTPGLNLTHWTIYISGTTDLTGFVTPSGGFDISRYIGTGSLTNTAAGDYLVLGNPFSSIAMANSGLTLHIVDSTGAFVDQVTIGGLAGQAPSGATTDRYNEALQRFPNGLDTDTDNSDWTKGQASLGTTNTGPSVTLSVSSLTIAEASGSSTITATLSAASSLATTVTLSASGTATSGTDYSLSSASIIIPAGSLTGTATLTSIQDAIDEYDETAIIDISSVTNGTEAGTQQQTVTILDDDPPPTVTLSVSPASISEAGEVSTITATLSSVSGKTVTVTLATSGTATGGGTDYSLSSTTITINPGNLTGTATVTAVQDILAEGNETVIVDITGVTNGTEDGVQQKTITILDDDLPTVTLSQSVTSFSEEGGTNTITATLDATYSEDAVITIGVNGSGTATEGVDFSLSSTTITIPAGRYSGTATLTGISDLIAEGNETIIVDILSADNAIELVPQEVASTLTDDDLAVTVSIAAMTQATEDATNGLFTISVNKVLSTALTVNLSISGTATNGTDMNTMATSVVIPAGSFSVTTPVTLIPDAIAEGTETVILTLGSNSGAPTGVTVSNNSTDNATVNITDNDLAVTVSIAATTQATEDATNGLFTISVDKKLSTALTVNLSTSGTATNGTDMNTMVTSVVIPAGSFSVTTPVTLIPDAIAEGTETVILTLGSNSGAPTGVTVSNNATDNATVNITDNDLAVTVSIAATTQATEDATNGLFTISVNKVLSTALTVNLSTSGTATNGTDMNTMATSVVIPAGSFSVTTPVTLIPDAIAEGTETVILTLGSNSGAPTGVTVSNNVTDNATVNITDNDLAVTLSIAATTQATEDATNGLFTISVDKKLSTALTVNLSTSGTATNGTDMNTMATSVVIPAGSFSVTTPVTLIPDAIAEGTETVILTLGSNSGAPTGVTVSNNSTDNATVNITDNDLAVTVSIAATTQATEDATNGLFTISVDKKLSTALTVNLSTSGTATNGTDMNTMVTSVVIPAGSFSVTTPVTLIPDAIAEGTETVILTLGSNSGAPTGVTVSNNSTDNATVNITDNDLAVTVSIAATTQATEDATNGLFTISVDKVLSTALTVNLSTSGTATNGIDMNTMATSVVIPAGSFSVTTPVTLIPDAIAEGTETVILTLGSNSGAPTGVTVSNNSTDNATVNITDNDLAVTVSIAATTQGTEDATNGLFTISVDKVLSTALTVNLSTSGTATNGTDMNTMATSVVIPAGSFSVTTPVTLIPDAIAEGTETVILTLGSNSGAPTGVTVSNNATDNATVNITDNDLAVTVSIAATTQATEDATNGLFTISVDKKLSTALTVNLSTSGTATNGIDMNTMATSVVIPAGSFSVTTPVTLIPDAIVEGTETVILTLGSNSGAPTGVTVSNNATDNATVNITDNDLAVTVSIAATTQATEDATNGLFTISVDKKLSTALTVNLSTSGTATNGIDMNTMATSVVIPAGSFSVTTPVTLIPDAIAEGTETVILTLGSNSGAPTGVTVSNNSTDNATVNITDNDLAVTVSIAATTQATEDATNGLFTISVDKKLSTALTVNLSTSGTATNGTDMNTMVTSVVIPAGSFSVTTPVTLIPDAIAEGTETVILTLGSNSGAPTGVTVSNNATDNATVNITDNDLAVTVSIAATTQATEDATNGLFTISVNKVLSTALTVNLSTSGTATNGTDMNTMATSVVIPAGSFSVTTPVTLIPDAIAEGTETVILTLGSNSGAPTGVTVSNNVTDNATVNITDNDLAVTLSIAATTQATEDATNGLFTISVDKKLSTALTVNLSTSGTATNGTDMNTMATSVVIPAGSFSVTTPIIVIADDLVESDETVILTLGSNSGAPTGVTVSNNTTDHATATIFDNDVAELSILATKQAAEDATDGAFTITTTKRFDAPVTVNLNITGTATNGTDYVTIGSSVVFPANQDTCTIPVHVRPDNLVENDKETVIVRMTGTSNADITAASYPNDRDTIFITDNDVATLRVVRKANAYENVSDGAFWVITTKKFDKDVNVGVSVLGTATAGSDYTSIATPQLFPAYTDTLTVPVAQIDDSESEVDEYIIMNLVSTDNHDVFIAPAPDSTATVTLFDDDMPLVSLSQSVTTIAEASGQDIITATINKVYFTDVIVTIGTTGTATPATDYTLPTTITIHAGSLTGTATLTAVQDQIVESDETVVVDILSVVNGVENGIQRVTSTILDNDTGVISVAATTLASEDATNGLFTIATDKQFDVPVTVTFTVGGTAIAGTDYTAIPGTTILLPALTSSITIPVNVIADNFVEPTETVIVTLTGNNNVKGSIASTPSNAATVNIADNDISHLSVVTTMGGTEGGPNGYFTINTEKQFSIPVTVNVLIGGSAIEGTDYATIGSTIVFPPYTTSIMVPVNVIDDPLVEGTEDVSILLQGTSFGPVMISGDKSYAVMDILDNDYAQMAVASLKNATEATITGEFAIFTDKVIERDVSIDLILSGTAKEGVDYQKVVLPTVFPAHQHQLFLSVEPISDEIVEGDETVNLSLVHTGNGNVLFSSTPDAVAKMKIIDDDTARFSIIAQENTGEGLADGSFLISSTKIFPEPVILLLNFSGSASMGLDYKTISTEFTFPALTYTATLPVSIIDDGLVEGTETITASIVSVDNSRAIPEPTEGKNTVLVSDNDFATISIEAISNASENGTQGLFRVKSDRPVETGVTITHVQSGSAIEGVDYKSLGNSLFLPAHTLAVDMPVIPLPDDLNEYIENVMVEITGTSNENATVASPPNNWASITIKDANHIPELSVLPVSGDEGAGNFRFRVTLSPASGKKVSVGYSTMDTGDAVAGLDFKGTSGTLVFNPSDTLKIVEVAIIDDLIDEYDETFRLSLNDPINADIIVNNGVGTILDNDLEPIVRLAFDHDTILENGGNSYLKAILDHPSGKQVAIGLDISGTAGFGVDYKISTDTLVLNPGQLSDSILLTSFNDKLDEENETVIVSIKSSQNARFEDLSAKKLVIKDQDQTISFGALQAKTYGYPDFTLVTGSTSKLEPVFISSNPDVATITGNIVKITGAGSVTITAKQPGNELFDPAPEVSQELVVNKAKLTATAEDKSRVYGKANPVLTISYFDFVNGDNATKLATKPVAATIADLSSIPGEYPITVAGGSDRNYEFKYISGKLTIEKASQSITFDKLPQVKKGDKPLLLSATSTSGLAVTYESSDPTKATISGNSVIIIESGTVQITAKQGGDMNYIPATDVSQTLVIKKPDGAELLKYNGLLCYPNPFDRIIYLNEVCEKAISINLYDLNGRKVMSPPLKVNRIDCSTLRDGVYLLEIDLGKGIKLKQQIVKK